MASAVSGFVSERGQDGIRSLVLAANQLSTVVYRAVMLFYPLHYYYLYITLFYNILHYVMDIRTYVHYGLQNGIKCVIMASVMRAEQGPCEPIKGCICEIREPERARVCQGVAVRASESRSGNNREP